MIKHTIQITVIDDSSREKCDADCGGADWSSPETLAMASQRIKDRFGDKIQLKYLNLSKARDNRDALEWRQTIENKNLSSPILVIKGQPRVAGPFDIRQLLDAIDAETEIGILW